MVLKNASRTAVLVSRIRITELFSNPVKTIMDDVIFAIPIDDQPYQTYATTGLDSIFFLLISVCTVDS